MSYKHWTSSLFLCSFLFFEVHGIAQPGKNNKTETGYDNYSPMRLTLRHIESGGVGYKDGYTTLEAFLAVPQTVQNCSPFFFDLRGHVFDNGRFAANGGIGARGFLGNRCVAIGGNVFYDYRNTSHQTYNQAGVGFEVLGALWDIHVNGYIPFGDKKSPFYDKCSTQTVRTETTQSQHVPTFAFFQGHNFFITAADIITKQTTFCCEKKKVEFAFKGVDADIGFQILNQNQISLKGAVGPYYYDGYYGKQAIGGRVRLVAQWKKYIAFGIYGSYDNVFHTKIQGQVAFMLPFGPKDKKCSSTCNRMELINVKLTSGVDRSEIIVLGNQKIINKSQCTKEFVTEGGTQIAINPLTNDPYVFWFVDNTSHSDGTFESPYNLLVDAQNASSDFDIIYVYPGDGTSTGMDAGIALKDNQKLLGSGLDYTLLTTVGDIVIPAQESGMPLITNSVSPAVSCANSNEIAGMHFEVPGPTGFHGLECVNIDSFYMHDNTIDVKGFDIGSPNVSGVFISAKGLIRAQKNTFNVINDVCDKAFQIEGSTDPNTVFIISENIFSAPVGACSTGIELGQGSTGDLIGDFNSLTISNNQFTGLGSKAIGGNGFSGTGRLIIEKNTFSQCDSNAGNSAVLVRVGQNGNLTVNVNNNIWKNSLTPAGFSLSVVNVNAGATSCIDLKNNTSDATGTAYRLNNSSGGTMKTNVSGNTGTVTQIGTTPGTGSCP